MQQDLTERWTISWFAVPGGHGVGGGVETNFRDDWKGTRASSPQMCPGEENARLCPVTSSLVHWLCSPISTPKSFSRETYLVLFSEHLFLINSIQTDMLGEMINQRWEITNLLSESRFQTRPQGPPLPGF